MPAFKLYAVHGDLPAIAVCAGIVVVRRPWRWQAGGRRELRLARGTRSSSLRHLITVENGVPMHLLGNGVPRTKRSLSVHQLVDMTEFLHGIVL